MHLIKKKGNEWLLDRYFHYLESIRDSIPVDLQSYLLDERRYIPMGPESLHDSWVHKIQINYPSYTETLDHVDVVIELLGPYHDRHFKLTFCEIKQLKMDYIPERTDLIMHEYYISLDRDIEYSMLFDKDLHIKIICSKFQFEERLI